MVWSTGQSHEIWTARLVPEALITSIDLLVLIGEEIKLHKQRYMLCARSGADEKVYLRKQLP